MVKIPLLSFKKVYNFGNYLAITPPYSFQKSKGYGFRCYVIVAGIVSVIAELWSVCYRSEVISSFRTSVRVSDVINEVTLFGTYLTIKLDLGLRKNNEWKNLLKLIHYLNKNLSNKNDENSVMKFLTIQIVVGHLFYFLATFYQWFALITTAGITLDFAGTYVVHTLSCYNVMYVIILMNTILFTLETKYKNLNNSFQLILTQKFLCYDVNKKNVGVIREVDFFFRKLEDCVDVFNTLFGNVVIMKLTNIVINVIVMINVSFLSSSLGPHDYDISTKDVLVSNVLATCFTMVCIVGLK